MEQAREPVRRIDGEVGDVFWSFEYMWRLTARKMVPLVLNGIKCANQTWYHHLSIIYIIVFMKKFTEF